MEFMEDLKEWLNYHHLRYFHAVAREGSISQAAHVLNASQPSICAQIKQLEAALGEVLYTRRGRSIALTDFGRTVYGYADEIFTLGKELLTTARRAPTKMPRRLQVGVVDSFPKLLCLEVLRPVFTREPPIQVTCREGKIDDLLAQLAAHRLDVLLSDEPPPSGAQVKTFNHPLGASGVTFCAAPQLAQKLSKRFPQNLHGAPMVLPTQNTTLRRDLEKWFRAKGVEPRVVADCEDAAFAKILASEGFGVTTVPTAVVAEAVARHGFVPLGKTAECVTHLYLITAERRLEHPAIEAMLQAWATRSGKGKTLPAVR